MTKTVSDEMEQIPVLDADEGSSRWRRFRGGWPGVPAAALFIALILLVPQIESGTKDHLN